MFSVIGHFGFTGSEIIDPPPPSPSFVVLSVALPTPPSLDAHTHSPLSFQRSLLLRTLFVLHLHRRILFLLNAATSEGESNISPAMPSHSTAQAICTRILIRARSRTALASRRHQSTFSFFSRNQDPSTPMAPTTTGTDASTPFYNATLLHASGPTASAASSRPFYTNDNKRALKSSASLEHAAPLLAAIRNKDQDTAWMIYSVLSRAGQLSFLLPLHHSLMLRSIRPPLQYRFTPEMVAQLTERFELVWRGMQEQGGVEPDMNDYLARLEFAVATRQYSMVDSTWIEMSEKAETSSTAAAAAVSRGASLESVASGRPMIQPTLYIYNLVLQSCVPRKNIGLATQTIAQMRRAGIKPDNMSWDYVMQIHTEMRNWQAVESTFRSAFVTTALTMPSQASPGGGATPQQQQQLQHQHDGSSEWMTIPLGQRTRSLHGGAFVPPTRNTSSSTNGSREKLIPSLQNIHTLFSYYAYTQDLEELRHMFDSHVRLIGLVPTTRSYNEMIKFAFLAKRDGDGLDLFKELVQIGQNLDKIQDNKDASAGTSAGEDMGVGTDQHTAAADLDGYGSASSNEDSIPQMQMQVCGPDWNTFNILINNELIDARNRWGRAWRWIQVMQDMYGLEPSDRMYRRTLAAMKRRKGGKEADEATIQAVQANWEQMRARREKRLMERTRKAGNMRSLHSDEDHRDVDDDGEEGHERKELAHGTGNT